MPKKPNKINYAKRIAIINNIKRRKKRLAESEEA